MIGSAVDPLELDVANPEHLVVVFSHSYMDLVGKKQIIAMLLRYFPQLGPNKVQPKPEIGFQHSNHPAMTMNQGDLNLNYFT